MHIRRLTALIIVVLAVVSACSSSPAKRVAPKDLEQQVADQVNAKKLTPTNVVCPKGLDARVGAMASCIVTANSLQYAAHVEATGIKGSKVEFKLRVPGPAVVPIETLEAQVTTVLQGRDPRLVNTVSCPHSLDGTEGRTTSCSVTAQDGVQRDVTVRVVQATLLNVALDVLEK